MCGLALAVAGGALAADDCCEPRISMTGGAAACTGRQVEVCEQGSANVTDGLKFGDIRNAICKTMTSDEDVLRAPCSPSPGSQWIKVGPAPGENQCCWISTKGLVTTPVTQTYQIRPCTAATCGNGPPAEQ